MTAVHILIFVEMAGFKIVPFIAMHVKKKIYRSINKKKKEKKSWSYEFFFFSQSELANLHENN